MAGIGITSAALRIFGDDLVPEEITLALGAEPTREARKGEVKSSSSTQRVAKTGFWQLTAADREPGDLDAQIRELFLKVSDDLDVWRSINERFEADIFCGLFMHETNEGATLEVETVAAMASRGLVLHLDIYGPSTD